MRLGQHARPLIGLLLGLGHLPVRVRRKKEGRAAAALLLLVPPHKLLLVAEMGPVELLIGWLGERLDCGRVIFVVVVVVVARALMRAIVGAMWLGIGHEKPALLVVFTVTIIYLFLLRLRVRLDDRMT